MTKTSIVKGLTTAAGMWTAGIIGLAIGAGFYEGGIAAALLVLFVEIVMRQFRSRIRKAEDFRFTLSYYNRPDLDQVLRFCKDSGYTITNLQITGRSDENTSLYSGILSLRASDDVDRKL